MADRGAAEKTEQPTPERIRKAREQGNVPQSQELPSALLLGGLLATAALAAPDLWQWFTAQVEEGMRLERTGPLEVDTIVHLFKVKSVAALLAMAPFLGTAAIAGMLGSVLVGGWTVSPQALKANFARMSPSSGLQTLFSSRSAMHLLASAVKLVILGTISWLYLRDKAEVCLSLAFVTPIAALSLAMQLIFGLVARVTVALLVIATADVLYQRWQYRRDLRMTREEVKEERRQHEGPPLARARVRSLHLAMVRKRMLRDVPKADVVLTNPTHVAVALKYDSATMAAPQVLAKGADLLCEKIKEIARRHDVPIVEKPELARTLYSTVEVGQTIPEALYLVVAEILAMIYRMRGKRA